ncbi:hypothetical protein ZIOFF_043084 [Zingiber officinale]|uniref:non-specific serine/threonine protein kinase n=1 Tax=Zingiber officinale TaxID=94328 RepID=A0A8J5FSN7_ZINOF|nr:hypothetical protein ZIOFF_043084 [Zingiber officinale]
MYESSSHDRSSIASMLFKMEPDQLAIELVYNLFIDTDRVIGGHCHCELSARLCQLPGTLLFLSPLGPLRSFRPEPPRSTVLMDQLRVFQSSVIWIWPFRELKMKPLVSWLNRGRSCNPFQRVFKSTFVGRLSIVKERFSKKYRHPLLDSKLTVKRLNMEVRCMTKARRLGVPTPVLYAVDPILHTLTFEYVDGLSVKEILLDFGLNGIVEEQLNDIAIQIGTAMGKMHDGGLIHGDLTTSNMIIRGETNHLVLIDFGLSFTSTIPENKAVDLYVLERALLSMHSSCGNVMMYMLVVLPVQMEKILSAYRKSSKQWSSTMNKLAQVRQRGRKRTMVG